MIEVARHAVFYQAIPRITNDRRDGVDDWDFKSCMLSIQFYQFISENHSAGVAVNEESAGRSARGGE